MLLFRSDGKAFKDMSSQSGAVFAKTFPARGLALDSNNDGPPVLLRNNIGKNNHWLGVRPVGRKPNPDAVGARLRYQAGDLRRSRMKVGGGSFLSAHHPRLVLGIGNRAKMNWLEIAWPQPGGAIVGLQIFR